MADKTLSTLVLKEVLQTIKDKLINDNKWVLSLENRVEENIISYEPLTSGYESSCDHDVCLIASGSEYNITLTLSTQLTSDHQFEIRIYISDNNKETIESYTYPKLSDKSEEIKIFSKYFSEITNQYFQKIYKILDLSDAESSNIFMPEESGKNNDLSALITQAKQISDIDVKTSSILQNIINMQLEKEDSETQEADEDDFTS